MHHEVDEAVKGRVCVCVRRAIYHSAIKSTADHHYVTGGPGMQLIGRGHLPNLHLD